MSSAAERQERDSSGNGGQERPPQGSARGGSPAPPWKASGWRSAELYELT
ncbi:hypothetical protein [Alteribacter keqinensis]|nr:hypothetical protein [Alteribacter keqinensis]